MRKITDGVSYRKSEGISPRERILSAASELFYRHGIRAVGVETIAEEAKTNKMTLYRHFTSKDELVAQYLQRLADKAKSSWDRLEAQCPGNPTKQLRAWLEEMAAHVASGKERGCALANAAVELPEKDHPARRVIEAVKTAQRQRLIHLCAGNRKSRMLDVRFNLRRIEMNERRLTAFAYKQLRAGDMIRRH
jgi:AcrR family transcriptional regulator